MATGIGAFSAVGLEPRVPSKPRAVFPSAALGVRQEWLPLFDRYGGDLVACGHTHQYETLIPAAAIRTTATLTPQPAATDTATASTPPRARST